MILRPYQDNARDKIKDELLKGRKRIILYSPTGSGKTEIGMDFIKRVVEKGNRINFICNRVTLVNQTSRRLHQSDIRHGIIQANNTARTYEPVLVSSIQTIASRGCPKADLYIIDEAHGTASSDAYRKFIEDNIEVPMIGLTATPFSKGLGKKYAFGDLWQTLVKATTIKDLIDDGYLVDCDIYAPGEPNLSKVKIVAGDYHEKQLGEAVDKPKLIGDIVTHWIKFANNKPTVCFATNIAHSKHITEQFVQSGIAAEHIDCYTSDEERAAILNRVLSGQTLIISNVGVLAEGWDFPACAVMILARPTRSLVRYIQMAGRVLRPADGKEKAIILDHSGTCKRLGFPTDDLPLKLDDGKPKDKITVEHEEKKRQESLPKPCPVCKFMMPKKIRKCPRCGHDAPTVNEVHTAQGELIQLRRGKKVKIADLDKNKTYAELIGFANQKGYKEGWAYYKCKELFGAVPRSKPDPKEPSDDTRQIVRHLYIKQAKSFPQGGRDAVLPQASEAE